MLRARHRSFTVKRNRRFKSSIRSVLAAPRERMREEETGKRGGERESKRVKERTREIIRSGKISLKRKK